MMSMKKLAIVALFGAQLLGSSALTQAAETKAAAPPSISVLTAQKKAIAEDLTVTGSFAAGELVLVSPEIEGLAVTEFLVEEGDTVKKDQVLARLNSASIDIQITQSNASLARNKFAQDQATNAIQQAQINRDHTSADLERNKKLRTTGIATQQTLDQFQAAFDLADAQWGNAKLGLEAAQADRVGIEAQLDGLKLNKSRTEIKSPVDGYVSNRSVQIGGIASGSKSPMYQIVASGIVKLVAEVPESELPRVKVGQKATITINGYDKTIEGEVRLISPEVNETTRVGLVHIRVADNVRIALGTFGRARISVAAADGVALPLTAVTFGDSGPTVQIVKDNKIEVRKVITGLVGANDIEISDGVQSGEIFVARAGSFVRDGDAVTPVPLSAQ
jgi:HlyD family secretion protein